MFPRILLTIVFVLALVAPADAAYHHMGEFDSDAFLEARPQAANTKLDSCALCHTGGSYQKGTKTFTMGSCQWCHYVSNYATDYDDFNGTLNPYGQDYLSAGRNPEAVLAVAHLDSDGDGYTNGEEVAALRFPGNADDDPSKFTAPYRVYTRDELENMPQHTQFLLMNTHKSGDSYAEYTGVPMGDLLADAEATSAVTGITVFAADGWAQYHPMDDADGFYPVLGEYPQAPFYYDPQADTAVNLDFGWCDYSSPRSVLETPGLPILNSGGNKLLLALRRDGGYMPAGELDPSNRLNGEGPYRVVVPQKVPGPPDQASTQPDDIQAVSVWPFDPIGDHNAGFSSRTATIIRAEPLPEGFTDLDVMEDGWSLVDEGKVVVYGDVDPGYALADKADAFMAQVKAADREAFKRCSSRLRLLMSVKIFKAMTRVKCDRLASRYLQRRLRPLVSDSRRGVVADEELRAGLGWALDELEALLSLR